MKPTLAVFLITLRVAGAFLSTPRSRNNVLDRRWCLALSLSRENEDSSSRANEQQQEEKQQQQNIHEPLVRAALGLEKHLELVSVTCAGICELPNALSTEDPQLCIAMQQEGDDSSPRPCLMVPLIREAHVQPVEAAVMNTPISNSILLRLNSIAVNRDEGLWDNLPWSQWSVDPLRRNYDAAGNAIDPKFHMGKRDAYNVMLGKDWFSFSSWSQAVSLVAQQLKRLSDGGNAVVSKEGTLEDDIDDDSNQSTLARRLLELQIREIQYSIAELESQIAVSRQDLLGNPSDQGALGTLEFQKEELITGLEFMKDQLEELERASEIQQQQGTTFLNGLIQRILDFFDKSDSSATYKGGTDNTSYQNAAKTDYPNKQSNSPFELFSDKRDLAPYRGATGYAPYRNALDREISSPFDLLLDIIENQLQAEVVGCVLENTSFLATTALGGAIVLRRKSGNQKVTIERQTFNVGDEDEDFGNAVFGGETFVVECEADEALGLSLACGNVPLQIEANLWQKCAVSAELSGTKRVRRSGRKLDLWRTVDPEISVLVEGQPGNQSDTERISPIRIPRNSLSLYDTIMEPRLQPRAPSGGTRGMFPSDNPIKSLAELDKLSDQDKARTLLSMSNFQGRLPRPRVVRQAKSEFSNPLDNLLIPLIDESVRRQYLIRDAKQRGDLELVRELEAQKSKRQKAIEEAEKARLLGEEELANQMDKEANLFESLRADATQDEGSYSRFLDRDEWYERERRKTASRVDKKKFGTLLDGLE